MALNLRGLFARLSNDTATVTSFSVGPTTPVTIATSNPDRLGVIIHNETGTLYVKEGIGASTTSYTYRLLAQDSQKIDSDYTGIITAIKQTGTTTVLVTQF